jgi:hypothetical protein
MVISVSLESNSKLKFIVHGSQFLFKFELARFVFLLYFFKYLHRSDLHVHEDRDKSSNLVLLQSKFHKRISRVDETKNEQKCLDSNDAKYAALLNSQSDTSFTKAKCTTIVFINILK